MRTAWADAKFALAASVGPIGTSSLFGARCGGTHSPGLRPTSPPSGQDGQNEKPLANRIYVEKETIGPLGLRWDALWSRDFRGQKVHFDTLDPRPEVRR